MKGVVSSGARLKRPECAVLRPIGSLRTPSARPFLYNASDMTKQGAGTRRERRSSCPVACTLDLIGDRWTLLVVRDLLFGKTRYGELLESAEAIPTNILAERLKRLCEAGLVESSPYSEHPRRLEYRLTERGRELAAIVQALAGWGLEHLPDTQVRTPSRA
jgi:DNA-binding HxlR family transcriptional regulator